MKNLFSAIWRQFADGLIAGLLIAIGGAVYLACYNEGAPLGKYVGAFLFSVALICICYKGYSLYTGKIGYVLTKHGKEDISVLLIGLLGNIVAVIGFGYLLALAVPSLKENAYSLCNDLTGKLSHGTPQTLYWQSFIKAVMCGVLIYLAVDIFRENKTTIGIIFCIPTFILCGFEHSIADTFYFATSGIVSAKALLFIFMIILGNSVGSLIIPLLKLTRKKENTLQ